MGQGAQYPGQFIKQSSMTQLNTIIYQRNWNSFFSSLNADTETLALSTIYYTLNTRGLERGEIATPLTLPSLLFITQFSLLNYLDFVQFSLVLELLSFVSFYYKLNHKPLGWLSSQLIPSLNEFVRWL